MTQQEFKDRTGITVTEERFAEIHAMYLESVQDMDKDTFCKDFKRHEDSLLLNIFYERVGKLEDKLDDKRHIIGELVNCLLKKSSEYGDEEMLRIVHEVLGEKDAIRRKVRLEIPLTADERNYIIDNLH